MSYASLLEWIKEVRMNPQGILSLLTMVLKISRVNSDSALTKSSAMGLRLSLYHREIYLSSLHILGVMDQNSIHYAIAG